MHSVTATNYRMRKILSGSNISSEIRLKLTSTSTITLNTFLMHKTLCFVAYFSPILYKRYKYYILHTIVCVMSVPTAINALRSQASQIHTSEIPDMLNKIYIWHSTYPQSCADYGQNFYVSVIKYRDCWLCDIFSKEAKLLCACQVWHSTTQEDFL